MDYRWILTRYGRTKTTFMIALAFVLAGTVDVEPSESFFSGEIFRINPVSDLELQETGGGFITRNGIRLDFGFEKPALVNSTNVLPTEFRSTENLRVSATNRFRL